MSEVDVKNVTEEGRRGGEGRGGGDQLGFFSWMYLQYSFFKDALKRVIIHKEEFKSKYKVWLVTY